jgi:hypothetical protein
MEKTEERAESMGEEKQEVSVSIRFPAHVWELLGEVAEREGRKKNAAVNWAVISYLQERGFTVDMKGMTDEPQKGAPGAESAG